MASHDLWESTCTTQGHVTKSHLALEVVQGMQATGATGKTSVPVRVLLL